MHINPLPGIAIGHTTLESSGCTVLVCPKGAIAAVDVRGGGPGTRETDLLEAHNTVERVHAIALCGGSAFGLQAAGGVMRELEAAGIGFAVLGPDRPGPVVPIVPAAVIFDLLLGDAHCRPGEDAGASACREALAQQLFDAPAPPSTQPKGLNAPKDKAANSQHETHYSSNIGAGMAASAGKLRGGFGSASVQAGSWQVQAHIVANPVGHVVDPSTGRLWGAPWMDPVDPVAYGQLAGLESKLNTTIGVITTDAPLTKAQAKRLAMVGHDGLARAIRPAHSPLDGDTLFALSTGDGSGVSTEALLSLSMAAADAVQAAIVQAVVNADAGFGLESYRSLRCKAS
ncbi:P1 family peptidase [Corynebacterium pseudopelargi]|uniref:Peptidase family S58 n=1 Tax=Corynebacterium pseudopelargi TaxID=2080757 RepID=A0A3G6ISL4_9CORY|nr:P1 family peptidase [Corynebacterium pseudopelargi]AZA08612.1 Peptidase family S58 [Corynebacterium pseudopelargi]